MLSATRGKKEKGMRTEKGVEFLVVSFSQQTNHRTGNHPKFEEVAEVHKLKVALKESAKSLPIRGQLNVAYQALIPDHFLATVKTPYAKVRSQFGRDVRKNIPK
ncbi:hypothetical protein KQX54_016543 [Cotesia glomerata]|uniref:Uncharacterized protein n=1 Tax=Cotesia glomerata TaxID=32391 RepID=A0AAV7HTL7_COTGL|nr:hypothetical protein KQX54_016543 [Cotesia glomerata]